jgi:hypothetical protein
MCCYLAEDLILCLFMAKIMTVEQISGVKDSTMFLGKSLRDTGFSCKELQAVHLPVPTWLQL